MSVADINKRMESLAQQIAAARKALEDRAVAAEKGLDAVSDFEKRYKELRAKFAAEQSVNFDERSPAEQKSLEGEFNSWVLGLDDRFNSPAKRVQSVSV